MFVEAKEAGKHLHHDFLTLKTLKQSAALTYAAGMQLTVKLKSLTNLEYATTVAKRGRENPQTQNQKERECPAYGHTNVICG